MKANRRNLLIGSLGLLVPSVAFATETRPEPDSIERLLRYGYGLLPRGRGAPLIGLPLEEEARILAEYNRLWCEVAREYPHLWGNVYTLILYTGQQKTGYVLMQMERDANDNVVRSYAHTILGTGDNQNHLIVTPETRYISV